MGSGNPKKQFFRKKSRSPENETLPIFIRGKTLKLILLHCRSSFPILIHCWWLIPEPYLKTLSWTRHYIITMSRSIPHFIRLSRTIQSLNTFGSIVDYIITLCRTITHSDTLSRNKLYLKTLSWTAPHLNTKVEVPSRETRSTANLETCRHFHPPLELLSLSILKCSKIPLPKP